jgi:hypothetical protein
MSSELERRLETMLAQAPQPDPGAEEKALHRALRALHPVAAPHRGVRAAVLAFAAVVVLLVIAAGSLAAVGALHVSIGAKPKSHPVTTQLVLPKGANGLAAIVDGRLSVVTRDGLGLRGKPVSAAALSPRALYVAAGVGNSLVAMAPNGRTAWSHPAGGAVVAIAWAPDGFQIAYVVHAGRRFVLHLIYGNGIDDKTIDRSVRPVTPSWRADSLAFAYVGGGGRAVVYDLAHRTHRLVGNTAPITHVAFAPTGSKLALATPGALFLGTKKVLGGEVHALGWRHGRLTAAFSGLGPDDVFLFAANRTVYRSYPAHGLVEAVTPKLVIVRDGPRVFAGHATLLTVPRDASVRGLELG